jgi:hypothetical protein
VPQWQPLYGLPDVQVSNLIDYCDLNKVSGNDLQPQLKSWAADGHIKELHMESPIQRRGGYLCASCCYLLRGNEHYTLESAEVKEATAYTQKAKEKFAEEQQAGAVCVKAEVKLKVAARQDNDPDTRQQLLGKLKLHAVALLHWRLQRVQGLQLGEVLGSMLKQQQQGQQAAQSEVRRAFVGGFKVTK